MNSTFNFYDELRGDLAFNKFEIDHLLFVEYNCPLEVERVKIWSKFDYVVYVLNGKKNWETLDQTWTANKGESLYIKKGANVLRQNFEEGFCMLGFFISDEIIKSTIEDIKGKHALPSISSKKEEQITRLNDVPDLNLFYESTLAYFKNSQAPLTNIMMLKAKELLLNIINAGNLKSLAEYFNEIANQEAPSISTVMEANFYFNLQLSEFAALCNRSLSSFKRDFKSYFGTTPGKWLIKKRLEYSANLLKSSTNSVSQIAYESGFEDLSHFSKTFKNQFGISPNSFRKLPMKSKNQ